MVKRDKNPLENTDQWFQTIHCYRKFLTCLSKPDRTEAGFECTVALQHFPGNVKYEYCFVQNVSIGNNLSNPSIPLCFQILGNSSGWQLSTTSLLRSSDWIIMRFTLTISKFCSKNLEVWSYIPSRILFKQLLTFTSCS